MVRSVNLLAVLALVAVLLPGVAPSSPAEAQSLAYDAAIDLTYPVGGSTSFIDDYHQCRGGSGCPRRHMATDIMAPYGAIVYAAMGGTITFITGIDSPVPSYGYMMYVAGDDGRRYAYVHLGRQDLGPEDAYAPGLRRGSRVERGQPIGINGCSGNASCSAPHLHFEIVDTDVTGPYDGPSADAPHRMNPYASLAAARSRGDVGTGSWRPFVDVSARNVHDADITWLAETGITRGCNPPTNDRFCPSDGVPREQMAAFLTRSLGLTQTSGVRFRDVPSGSRFEQDIDRLATAGITRGCNPPANDRFCPGDIVTREQMASFLVRGYRLPAGSATFRDVAAGSTHAGDISRLAAAGVTRGCNPPTNDRFCPTSQVTREQMASFLRRAG